MIKFWRLPKLPPEAIKAREEAVKQRDEAKRKKWESLGMLASVKHLASKLNEVNEHNSFREALFDPPTND